MDLTLLRQEPGRAEARLTFAAADPWVREHFPGAPILPGSLALAALLHLACCLAPQAAPTVRRLRCLAPMPPGTYHVVLEAEGTRWQGALTDTHGQTFVTAEILP